MLLALTEHLENPREVWLESIKKKEAYNEGGQTAFPFKCPLRLRSFSSETDVVHHVEGVE